MTTVPAFVDGAEVVSTWESYKGENGAKVGKVASDGEIALAMQRQANPSRQANPFIIFDALHHQNKFGACLMKEPNLE